MCDAGTVAQPEEVAAEGPSGDDDDELLAAVRAGDEQAFAALVERHSPAMLRLAMTYARSHALAEEVVQDAWMGVLRSLPTFEARSSLRTWILRILVNRARTSAVAAARHPTPVDTERSGTLAGVGPVVDPDRLQGPPPGHWSAPPSRWDERPEEVLVARETIAVIEEVIARLPASQRAVIQLRDRLHHTSAEVCDVLGISAANQRVLLHRARAHVRSELEAYLHDR